MIAEATITNSISEDSQFMERVTVAGQMSVMEPEPEFLQPLENHTVTQGRDIFFTCVVNHLGPYKVCVRRDFRF
jgi:hypothetical protein